MCNIKCEPSGQRILNRGRITGGIFHWENLTCHFTAPAAGQSELWSTACGEIATSGLMGRRSAVCWKIPTMTSPENCSSAWGIWTASNTWFLGHITKSIVIGSATFARMTVVKDRQTDRPHYSVQCSLII